MSAALKIKPIQGAGGGGKGKGGASGGEADDTLRSRARGRLLFLISEGQLEAVLKDGAKSIYFDRTALQNEDDTYNFKGVIWEVRDGLPDQDYLNGVPYIETPVSVETEVTNSGGPITRTVNEQNATAARVIIRIPALAKSNDEGKIVGTSLSYSIAVRPYGGSYTTVVSQTFTNEKTTSPYQKAHRVELPAGGYPWDIKVTRNTADSADIKLQNETWWESYTSLVEGRFTFPNSALLFLDVDSEQFGSSIPNVSTRTRGIKIKVPVNYDPETRAYDGVWNGTFKTAWTDNPAWILYDLLTNDRYGLGEFISSTMPDKWSLYAIAQYCDELVPSGLKDGLGDDIMEPRFTFNGVINNREEAWRVLQNVAAQFRGMTYWSLGQVFPVADMPADPLKPVTPANVIGGDFDYQGTSIKARHSVAIVKWNDPNDFYRPATEVVISDEAMARYGWRETSVQLMGCTSRGQAHRFGKWILDTEQNETETVTYTASWDHAGLMPGQIIQISDPKKATIRAGGRLRRNERTQDFVLDGTFMPTTGQTYKALIALPNGTSEEKDITNFLPCGFDRKTLRENHVSMQGAVVGVLPTGKLPLAWTAGVGSGVSAEVTAQGFDAGIPYFDVRIYGTNSGGALAINLYANAPNFGPAAAAGDKWTFSAWLQQTAGAFTGFTTNPRIRIQEFDSTAFQASIDGPNITSTMQRLSISGTLSDADTDNVVPVINAIVGAGATVNVTLRVKGAQFEKGDVVNDYVPVQDYGRIRLASALADPPVDGAVWIITGTDLTKRLYRTLAVREVAKNQFTISALQHDPNKYDRVEQNLDLDTVYYTPAARTASPPLNVSAEETFYLQDGNHYSTITLSWSPPADLSAKAYRVTAQTPSGYRDFGTISNTFLDIRNAELGDWIFTVASISFADILASADPYAFEAIGWTAANLPTVSGLARNTAGSGSNFSGRDCGVKWTNNFPDTSFDIGTTDDYAALYRDNVVRVRDSATDDLLRTVVIVGNEFLYTFEQNVADNVAYARGPSRGLKFEVEVRDTLGRTSSAASLTLTNPAPAAITPTCIANGTTVVVNYTPPTDLDWTGALIWISTNPSFVPGSTSPVYDGPNTNFTYPTGVGTYYVKMAAYDAFSKAVADLNVTGSNVTVSVTGAGADTTPPALPTGLTAGSAGFGIVPISWTNPADADFDHVEAWINTSNTTVGARFFTDFKGTTGVIDGMTPGATYYVFLKSVDKFGNVSSFTSGVAITSLLLQSTNVGAGQIDNAAIAAAAVTGTKIQNGAVGTTQLANDAVTSPIIANSAVGTTEIANGAVTGANIAASTVTASNIAALTITANEIAANTITGGKIAADTITANNLAADSVTAKQLAIGNINNIIHNGAFANNNFDGWTDLEASLWSIVARGGSSPQSIAPTPYMLSIGVDGTNRDMYWGTEYYDCRAGDQFFLAVDAAATDTSTNTIRFYLTTIGADGTINNSANLVNVNVNTTGWLNYSLPVSMPAGTAGVRLRIYRAANQGTGTVFMTNIRLYRMNEASLIQNGAITTAKIAAGAVTANEIAANTITAAKIAAGTITATEIAADTITAANIAANAITAKQLAIGNFDNLVLNPTFADGTTNGWSAPPTGWVYTARGGSGLQLSMPASAAIRITGGDVTGRTMQSDPGVWNECNPDDQFYFSVDMAADAAPLADGMRLQLQYKLADGTITTPAANAANSGVSQSFTITTSWATYNCTLTAPANCVGVKAQISREGNANAANIFWTDLRAIRIKDGTLIKDGAITTAKITAGAVTANEIAAATITGAKIAAGTITASNIAALTITANEIAASTITAAKLNVTTLSAITANVGTLTAGIIQGPSTGLLIDITNNLIRSGNYAEDGNGNPYAGYRLKGDTGEIKAVDMIASGLLVTKRPVILTHPNFRNGIPDANPPFVWSGRDSTEWSGTSLSWGIMLAEGQRTPEGMYFYFRQYDNNAAAITAYGNAPIAPEALNPQVIVGDVSTRVVNWNPDGTINAYVMNSNGSISTTSTARGKWIYDVERDPLNLLGATKMIAGLGFSRIPFPLRVPAGATYMDFKVWGAGGGNDNNSGGNGGPGGYVAGRVSVGTSGLCQVGDLLWLIVGEGGLSYSGKYTLGFGGPGQQQNERSGGGGLSGVFRNSITRANALLIAGGGGGGEGGQSGGPGGSASSGSNGVSGYDYEIMSGLPWVRDGSNNRAGGGGGYVGGGYLTASGGNSGGRGGTNYIKAGVTSTTNSSSSQSGNGNATTAVPPNSSDSDLVANQYNLGNPIRTARGKDTTNASHQGGNGLIVVTFG